MVVRPILFSAPMARALLAGTKTQTRRIVKGDPVNVVPFIGRDDQPTGEFGLCLTHERVINKHVRCPYGLPGDLLIVREGHAFPNDQMVLYRANWREDALARGFDNVPVTDAGIRWRPSIHMPRWASRLTLEITDVRVERLQDISEEDALAEGVREPSVGDDLTVIDHGNIYKVPRAQADPLILWRFLWLSIHGADSWAANPWAWAVSFKLHRQNVDSVLAAEDASHPLSDTREDETASEAAASRPGSISKPTVG